MTAADTRPTLALAPSRAFPAELDATRVDWLGQYTRGLVFLDVLVLVMASLLGVVSRFGFESTEIRGIPYLVGSLLLVPVWVTTLALSRCYERRFLGSGAEEFKRVGNASFRVVACLSFALFMTKTDASRGVVAITMILGLVMVVAGRYGARIWLHRQRKLGQCMHATVVVGPAVQALEMTTTLQAAPMAGLQVVGACVTGDAKMYSRETLIPVLGNLSDVLPVLEELRADTVVVAKGPGISSEDLRQLSYELEGTGIDLLVSPALTNVTGSRIHWREMPGLALLHVEEPELSGARRIVKGAFDRSVAAFMLLMLSPLLLGTALAVRVTSAGPAFFFQERVGRNGETFKIWKFRSMYVDAEQRLAELSALNVHGDDGVLFKMHDDPRITKVGKFIRRYSIDELPQLMNVVLGHMSLVGPRPPLVREVAQYDGHVHRRLLVKPGMTGLWQVSGRSDLSWEDSVRLDLHYVENWSLGLDIAVLCKTFLAVLRPSGAY